MVAYVLRGRTDHIFDPAVGAGAFFRAAKVVAEDRRREVSLLGTETDRAVLEQARLQGLTGNDLDRVQITDFVLDPPARQFRAIVANPPYIRHHRLPLALKAQLIAYGARLIGRPLDGRAGIHVYFLIRALELLERNGRLAFILPADTCEGVFAPTLWNWITRHYRLDAVITFAHEATPFPGVDTNAVIFMLRNATPCEHFFWARCNKGETNELRKWTISGFRHDVGRSVLSIFRRRLSEGLDTGLSRLPVESKFSGYRLGDVATVMRGVATGANRFFFLTRQQARHLKLPSQFLTLALGRTRDVSGYEVTSETVNVLDAKGRPTLLFSPDGRPIEEFPPTVREYLKQGEELGLHKRPLIASRRPWYKMEVRKVPPILFTYLGRRNARFVRNRAGLVPLTSFLCVYPHHEEGAFVECLWEVLCHPKTLANLPLVAKSYGGGAIKVEPRALERLPLFLPPRTGEVLKPTQRAEQPLLSGL